MGTLSKYHPGGYKKLKIFHDDQFSSLHVKWNLKVFYHEPSQASSAQLPRTAALFLSLNSTHGNALGEILLEAKEHNNDGNRSQGSSCHDKPKVIGHLA